MLEEIEKSRKSLREQSINIRAFIRDPYSEKQGPTPETKRKFKIGTIEAMRRIGSMSSDQERAVWQILDGFNLITGSLGYKLSSWEKIDCSTNYEMEGIKQRRVMALYKMWLERVGRGSLGVSIAFDVILERMSLNQCTKKYRLDHRTVKRQLLGCLDHYCIVAGWIKA